MNSLHEPGSMKYPCISLCLIFSGLVTPVFSNPPAADGKIVKHEVYSGYFVSNQFESQQTRSYVDARTRQQFDRVFGVAFVMGDKSHRLAPGTFQSQRVLAVIRRGMEFCTYRVKSVTEHEGSIHVHYETEVKKSESASFACPLIISIPRGSYQAIEFHENKKLVKRLVLKNS